MSNLVEKLKWYKFRDENDHPLENCAELIELIEAAEGMLNAWASDWDCSHTPGHPAMDSASEKLREALNPT